uniref:Uncharacterized protein n=1 Tax=Moniliophthora roreri TaxID=221103 RepID=A0A0W0GC83_MONRR
MGSLGPSKSFPVLKPLGYCILHLEI